MIGLLIFVPAARSGFLIPQQQWNFSAAKDWPAAWMGSVEIRLENLTAYSPVSIGLAWLPYVLLAAMCAVLHQYRCESVSEHSSDTGLGWYSR
ncbi:hypothetical protein [Nitrosomonas aestuarii]|uniref:hypothetical protein n=1 Tax=Nitrosomonas aestuarii TaxID=52441 RepID=UPI001BA68C07|nr:hypothetical protein [Nitrosomonas aestuarii]